MEKPVHIKTFPLKEKVGKIMWISLENKLFRWSSEYLKWSAGTLTVDHVSVVIIISWDWSDDLRRSRGRVLVVPAGKTRKCWNVSCYSLMKHVDLSKLRWNNSITNYNSNFWLWETFELLQFLFVCYELHAGLYRPVQDAELVFVLSLSEFVSSEASLRRWHMKASLTVGHSLGSARAQ